jgi:DNA-directed RNA polymerase specialized sigma24 family protein
VDAETTLKKDWVLTQDAFDVLLSALDADRERAGQRYEQIRHGLITFFECRGSAAPDADADETINRVARRLSEGTTIYSEQASSYFYGVARNVLKESWDARTAATAIDTVSAARHPVFDPARRTEQETERLRIERRLDCLERCLTALAPFARDLITGYYQGDSSVKIRNRKALADRLGLPINALRIRALRIREKLEGCVSECHQALDPR